MKQLSEQQVTHYLTHDSRFIVYPFDPAFLESNSCVLIRLRRGVFAFGPEEINGSLYHEMVDRFEKERKELMERQNKVLFTLPEKRKQPINWGVVNWGLHKFFGG